jgi:hypothetical protein
MILEKRPPALRWWPEAAAHIPSDRRLDLEAEHHQLTMNARRAPEQVFFAHSSDQILQFSRDPRSAVA